MSPTEKRDPPVSSATPPPLIHVADLTKQFRVLNRREGLAGAVRDLVSRDYRSVEAVRGISFDIERGEIVGYIGPNGAGKSTTIKMMTGILKPTDGSLTVAGAVPYENRKQQARSMGVVFGQRTQLWWDLPVIESFKILREIYRIPPEVYEANLATFDRLVNLSELYAKPVRTMSLGQRMLCDIAAAFLHNPSVVFLDEPTIGLDVSVKAKIRELIAELNRTQKTTVILTTHDLGDVEALCRRIIIIDKGLILFDGPVERVKELFGDYRTLRLQIAGFEETACTPLLNELKAHFGQDRDITVRCQQADWARVTINQERLSLSDVLAFVLQRGDVRDVQIVEISMENVVQRIYDGSLDQ